MKIGVISDTHDNKKAIYQAIKILNRQKVDIVIHAGDHISPFVVKWMGELRSKVIGVAGNNEGEKELLKKKYLEKNWEYYYDIAEIYLNGNIIVYHGTEENLVRKFISSGKYDVVIRGHTHSIIKENINNALHLNPGEVCGYLTGEKSLAILKMPEKKVEIIYF